MIKKILFVSTCCILCFSLGYAQGHGQAYQMSDEIDFSPFQTVYKADVEICDVKQGYKSIACIQKQMRHDAMNKGLVPYEIKRGGIRVDRDNSAVRTSRGVSSRKVEAQAKQRRDAERSAFMAKKRAERLKAAREARMRQIAREKQRRDENNRRSAMTEANVNIALQTATDRRIANDNWHATEGRELAREIARKEVGQPQGMSIVNNKAKKSTGHSMAQRMRDNKNVSHRRRLQEGGMKYYSRRPMPPVVRQQPDKLGKYVFTGRATKSQIFIERDRRLVFSGSTNGPALAKGGTQFVLNPNATVTTGQDWHSDDFEFKKREIPRPATRIIKNSEVERQQMLDELLPPVDGTKYGI